MQHKVHDKILMNRNLTKEFFNAQFTETENDQRSMSRKFRGNTMIKSMLRMHLEEGELIFNNSISPPVEQQSNFMWTMRCQLIN